jgi:hypothetical protein
MCLIALRLDPEYQSITAATTHIPSLSPVLCLGHIVPPLAVPTEEDDFVLHALLAFLVQPTHVLLEPAPLLFRVTPILIPIAGFFIQFLILPIYEPKVLLLLERTSLAPGSARRSIGATYKVKRPIISLRLRLKKEARHSRVPEMKRFL